MIGIDQYEDSYKARLDVPDLCVNPLDTELVIYNYYVYCLTDQ